MTSPVSPEILAAPEPLPSPVIDTHTHLNLHDRYLHGEAVPDADGLLALAAEVGVTKVVQIGCDVQYARTRGSTLGKKKALAFRP